MVCCFDRLLGKHELMLSKAKSDTDSTADFLERETRMEALFAEILIESVQNMPIEYWS